MPERSVMEIRRAVATVVKRLDRQFGFREWCRGEPRPPRGGFDLAGEKIIDWGWVCVHLPTGSLRALEVGCGESPIIPAMLARGYNVTGVDPDASITTAVNGFGFICGDFNEIELIPGFDLVIACSSIEHFGLAGRYGATADDDADLKAARKIHSLLAPSGRLLLTIPVGMDAVHVPWHRVYGSERLPRLIEGFTIVEARFWTKSPWQPWYETTMQHALNQPVALQRYALGQFALTKATGCGHQRLAIRNDITIPTSVRPS